MKSLLKSYKFIGLPFISLIFATSCIKILNFQSKNPASTAAQATASFKEFSEIYKTEHVNNLRVTSLQQDLNNNIHLLTYVDFPNDSAYFNINNVVYNTTDYKALFYAKFDLNGNSLIQNGFDISSHERNVSYIKTPGLFLKNNGEGTIFGNKGFSGLDENSYFSHYDANGLITDTFTDTVSTGATPYTYQTHVIPSFSNNKYYMLASVSNTLSSLNNFSFYEFNSLPTNATSAPLSANYTMNISPALFMAVSNQPDSQGNIYFATPAANPSSLINIYKYNPAAGTGAPQSFQTIDMASFLGTNSGQFNPNRINYFQIYVDSLDNIYLYGTLPLGSGANDLLLPPEVPADASFGFIAKLDPALTSTPLVTFIRDESASSFYQQNISINDLKVDASGDIYITGNFNPAKSPTLFGSSGLSGFTSSYIAKYSASSIGTVHFPQNYRILDYFDVNISTDSLLVSDKNVVYISGSIETYSSSSTQIMNGKIIDPLDGKHLFLSLINLQN